MLTEGIDLMTLTADLGRLIGFYERVFDAREQWTTVAMEAAEVSSGPAGRGSAGATR